MCKFALERRIFAVALKPSGRGCSLGLNTDWLRRIEILAIFRCLSIVVHGSPGSFTDELLTSSRQSDRGLKLLQTCTLPWAVMLNAVKHPQLLFGLQTAKFPHGRQTARALVISARIRLDELLTVLPTSVLHSICGLFNQLQVVFS
jgi:hypothetical protein